MSARVLGKRIVSWLAACVAIAVAAACLAWLAGRIVSDRYAWSQWLLWIPTPAVLAAVAVALAVRCLPHRRRRRRLVAWGVSGGVLLAYFCFIEHRFLRPGAEGGADLRLVHASVQATGPRVLDAYGRGLTGLGGDVTVVSTLLPSAGVHRLIDRLGGLGAAYIVWPFVMFTELPVVESRPLVANAQFRAAVFRVDATATLGRVVTIWVVDLPSDPRRHRYETALRVRAILDTVVAEPPDLVVGDFNMTRGSASLSALFPDLTDAYDAAGRGYGASFHRVLPMYHIDHTLVADTVTATGYDLVDLGVGRHLVQVTKIGDRPLYRPPTR